MSDILDAIKAEARKKRRHIVLPEGHDPRIQAGGVRAQADGLARITFLGEISAIASDLKAAGEDPQTFCLIDPARVDISTFARSYHALRRHKGVSEGEAALAVRDPLTYAAMMVRLGVADGTVAGAVATTADTVRTAFQVIGPAKGAGIVSSAFLMICKGHHFAKEGTFLFADCALIVEPSAEELAEIAMATAETYRRFIGGEPRVAMLSFSTAGSANHPHVDRVREAVRLVRGRRPDIVIEGDIQFDAAFVPAIAGRKLKGSPLQGDANVFVFPNLEAGNIGYKIAERFGGAAAVGPVLQGLSKPANDLSRGCSAHDIYDLIAITAVQAGH